MERCRPLRRSARIEVRALAALVALAPDLSGCAPPGVDCRPIGTLASHGLARAGVASQRHACVQGWVDRGNLYGDAGVRARLGRWWSGPGPHTDAWRFDLLARADEPIGHGVPVQVPNDAGRDMLIARLAADADAGRATAVCVCGGLVATPAPTNLRTFTALALHPNGTGDIRVLSDP
jgi:hypothetical protein